MQKLGKIFFILLLTMACTATEPEEPDDGRCFIHKDCGEGKECVSTRCQDIYYPRHEIKPF